MWSPPGGCAKTAALRIGCMLLPTIVQGDCALDCMAFHLGLPRNVESWLAIRSDLSSFLRANAGSTLWQHIAKLGGEAERGDPPDETCRPCLGQVLLPLYVKASASAVAPLAGHGGSFFSDAVVEAPAGSGPEHHYEQQF